jgi:pyrethroid hydrolase
VPVFTSGAGTEIPLLRVDDPGNGESWWIRNDGWDAAGKRHLNEMQRSAGIYTIRIDKVTLRIFNRLSNLGRADVQAYVDDFRGDLVWMIMSDESGATASANGAGSPAELLDALDSLSRALQRIQASPSVMIRETQTLQPVGKVRANAATFRQFMSRPTHRHVIGRSFYEAADTPENRYLRHVVAVSLKVVETYVDAAASRASFFERLAAVETQRGKENREMERRPVDPLVWDQQTDDIEQRLEALHSFGDCETSRKPFPLKLKTQARPNFSFYYERQESAASADDRKIAYRMVIMPRTPFELILRTRHFCRKYKIAGSADSKDIVKKQQWHRELRFESVEAVEAQTNILSVRASKRIKFEDDGWTAALRESEKLELNQEAEVCEQRAREASRRGEAIASSLRGARTQARRLAHIDADLASRGISCSPTFPASIKFLSNPDYAACIAAFKKINDVCNLNGLDAASLDAIGRIGIFHASDIYEKWCLIKLFSLLTQDFRFIPESGWQSKLTGAVLARAVDARFEFSRPASALKVVLTYQATLRNGRRPDFVLQVFRAATDEYFGQDDGDIFLSGIVMDAKFRTAWRPDALRRVLDELIHTKDYGTTSLGAGVFIIQPCEFTVHAPESPLNWGRHCDYGSQKSHKSGWVQAGVTSTGVASVQHLKRLLIMVFQKAFTPPVEVTRHDHEKSRWFSDSFCLECGEPYTEDSINAQITKGRQLSWRFTCARCQTQSKRTHCYECASTSLFKNGTRWTYHNTVADQITNVLCPKCGAFFYADWDAGDR